MKNTFKPILFSSAMVNAILDGTKTQTRRIVKDDRLQEKDETNDLEFLLLTVSHKIKEADILWVRESFLNQEIESRQFTYKADYTNELLCKLKKYQKWKPSIHMPKKACRIFLKVKSVKIELLQNISEEDSIAEGCSEYGPFGEYKGSLHPNGDGIRCRAYSKASRAFQCIWESINGTESWKKNPFVWVIEFERIDKPFDFI